MATPATPERAAELLAAFEGIQRQVIEAAQSRSETDKVSSPSFHSFVETNSTYRTASIGRRVEIEAEFRYFIIASSGRHSFRGELRPGASRQSTGGMRVDSDGRRGQVLTCRIQLPSGIQWHFIGALQSNKCKSLAGQSRSPPPPHELILMPIVAIPNLFAVETLSSSKSADLLEKTLAALTPQRKTRLNVYIQINTSNEESKAGLSTHPELISLATHILQSCPHIRLFGLMTIGSASASADSGVVNPDFVNLKRSRVNLIRDLVAAGVKGVEEIEKEGLELSMGMSGDFEVATREGSSNVRVGSSIFGARPPFRPAA